MGGKNLPEVDNLSRLWVLNHFTGSNQKYDRIRKNGRAKKERHTRRKVAKDEQTFLSLYTLSRVPNMYYASLSRSLLNTQQNELAKGR